MSTEDVVLEAVKLGYKIADEQILKGQDLARRLRSASVRSDLGDVGELVDHGMRLVRQFAILLVELTETGIQTPAILRALTRHAAGEKAADGDSHSKPSSASPQVPREATRRAQGSVSLPIQVRSTREVLVSANLYRQPDLRTEIYPLFCKDSGTALKGVSLQELPGSRISLRVDVDQAQPAGLYRGYAIDAADEEPIGIITVQVI